MVTRIDLPALEGEIAALTSSQNTQREKLASIRDIVMRMADDWDSPAQQEYQAAFERIHTDAQAVLDALDAQIAQLRRIHDAYDQIETAHRGGFASI